MLSRFVKNKPLQIHLIDRFLKDILEFTVVRNHIHVKYVQLHSTKQDT